MRGEEGGGGEGGEGERGVEVGERMGRTTNLRSLQRR